MTRLIRITMANDLKEFMQMATKSDYDIGVHAEGNQIADAKSILGLMTLDFDHPIRVVTDDERFLKHLDKWAVEEK